METESFIPIEYCLENIIELEPSRFQSYKNCWANAIASLVGDTFCLENNLLPIIPSSIWITSMRKDACEYYNLPKCDFPTLNIGFNTGLLIEYMKRNKNKYYVKLERCFPELDTIQMIFEKENKYADYELDDSDIEDNLDKKMLMMKLNYFDNIYDNCCVKEDNIKGKRKRLDCILPKNEKNELEMIFQLKIKNFYKIDFDILSKENYTSTKIKNIQNMIKQIIYCKKKPILTSILSTKEYSFNLQNLKLNNYYYQIKTKVLSKAELSALGLNNYTKHAIIIYGWEKNKENNQEYWIVRDSNIYSFEYSFYKIPFSTMDNIDYWIGCDIDWIDIYFKNDKIKEKERIDISLIYIDVTTESEYLESMLKEGIFKKV